MEMELVKSSHIEAIGYDKKTKTVAVRFLSGKTYHYRPINFRGYVEFKEAPSLGKHLHANFRNNPKITVIEQQ